MPESDIGYLVFDIKARSINLGATAKPSTPGATFQDELTELKEMYQNVVSKNPNHPYLVMQNKGERNLVLLGW